MKKKLLLLLVICLAAAALTTGAAADGDAQGSNVQYGSINNDQISWSYDSDSHFLTIECNVETGTSMTLNRDMVRNIVDAISASEKNPLLVDRLEVNGFYRIEDEAFFRTRIAIKELVLGEPLRLIGIKAFSYQEQLTTVTFPKGLYRVDEEAFRNCTSLISVEFNDLADSAFLGEGAFRNCTSLKSITIPSFYDLGEYAFYGCSSLETAYIMANMVDAFAFSYCSSLRNVTLDGVEYIDGTAFFSGCGDISITIKNVDVLRGYGSVVNFFTQRPVVFMSNCITSVTFEEGVKRIDDSTFIECFSLTTVSIPNTVESIGSYAFGSCTGLESLTIPDSVTSIDEYAFSQCSSLTSITLPENLKTISNGTFSECSSLVGIDIPNTVTKIGANAFYQCEALNNVEIPDSVTVIGENAFADCSSLTSAKLSQRIAQLPAGIFSGCSSLVDVSIPAIVNSIGDNAFNGCIALPSLEVARNVTYLGGGVFDNCNVLNLKIYAGSYIQAYAETYDIPYTLLADGTEDTVNSIESVTSAPGFDKDGKPCTVVTITMTNGDVEEFYIYDGEDGQDGEDGKDGEDGEDGQDGEIIIVPSFSDVPADSYYSDAVNWAVANGITTGTSNGEFSPDDGCSRAQIVTFLWRAMGSPEPTGSSSFNDVPADSYYGKAAQWALENGITTGVGGSSFGSNSTVTRAEVVTFLWRAAGSPTVSGSGFADVDSSAYYSDAVAWAVANGITTGTGESTFSPDSSCTRAQIVTFLYRYFN